MANKRFRAMAAVLCVALLTLSVTVIIAEATSRPVSATTSPVDGATRGADNYRTGWYPDQTNLTPGLVTGGTFGQLFKTGSQRLGLRPAPARRQPGAGQHREQLLLRAQPGHRRHPLEPPVRGAGAGQRDSAAPTSPPTWASPRPRWSTSPPTPSTWWTTSTSPATRVPQAYYMHALNLDDNGAEEPGFPGGDPGDGRQRPRADLQRRATRSSAPGCSCWAVSSTSAFAGHCDITPYQGWIAGVSEAGDLTTMWTDAGRRDADGGGIWMSGGGLVSDGPGTILFTTGNGDSSGDTPGGTIPGDNPPADLGESVVRLDVQPNGSLKAVDFFAPYDAPALDTNDLDFGSGSPVALPEPYFGTTAIPHLAVAVGKEGYVYLLNRDNLGGEGEGPNGTDDVVGRYGPNGGVWSSPAVWPGNGGWIYIPTASGSPSGGGSSGFMDAYQYGVNGSGDPDPQPGRPVIGRIRVRLERAGRHLQRHHLGSALMWTVWSPDGTGVGAQLRAYDPVPVDGVLQEVWSAPVGTASKFNPPGVGGNRLYVGTRDGYVIGFGAPVAAPVTATPPTFPATVVGPVVDRDAYGHRQQRHHRHRADRLHRRLHPRHPEPQPSRPPSAPAPRSPSRSPSPRPRAVWPGPA